jgi:(p)ppGpp synthase/HD superfamily hydrolase
MALYPELLKKAEVKGEKPATEVVGLKEGQSHIPAKCCKPLPGERIVGITVRGRGVVVHTIDCDALEAYEGEQDNWIDLRWTEGMSTTTHNTTIEIIMANDAGVLGRICTLIGEHNANIADIHFTERKPDFYRIMVDMQVRNVTHMMHIRTAIEADADIASVTRYRNPKDNR